MNQPQNSGTNSSTTEIKQVATDVGQAAKEHVRGIGEDVSAETRHLAGELRQRLSDEASTQNERLSNSLRQLSDDLGGMRTNVSNDSLAASVVQRLSEGSRQVADYLEQQGPDGVMREVQEFARRKPGTFLVSAALAGFVVGRLGKGVFTGGSNGSAPSMGQRTMPPATTQPMATSQPTATATAPVLGTSATMPSTSATTPSTSATMPGSTPTMPVASPSPGSPAATSRRQSR